MIPKIIHQIYINPPMPENILVWIDLIKNTMPEYEYKLWDENMFYESFPEYLTKRYILDQLHPAMQTDFFRLVILQKFGGVYMDCDIELHKSIEPILTRGEFVGYIGRCTDTSFVVDNYFFACVPDCQLLAKMISSINWEVKNVLMLFGYLFYARFFCAYNDNTSVLFGKEALRDYFTHHSLASWVKHSVNIKT